MSESPANLRIDKWLWAARFFKTRSRAKDAIDGGKVSVNGHPVKPAREIRIGDELVIHAGEQDWTVVVRGLNEMRRPASEARRLYEETPESVVRRERAIEIRKLAPMPGANIKGRPTKRAGRLIRRFSES